MAFLAPIIAGLGKGLASEAGIAGLMGAGGQIAGGLMGSSQTTSGISGRSFDPRALPLLRQVMAESGPEADKLRERLLGLSGQRMNRLTGNIDRQLQALQGFGQQEISDINQRYDSRLGGARQGAASRGLYNTSVLPGMSALVDRERNRALGQARERQQRVIGGALGQRAQSLDRANLDELKLMSGLAGQRYAPWQQALGTIAQSTRSEEVADRRQPSLFKRLFG